MRTLSLRPTRPGLTLVVGFACLIAGLAVWLKRKDYRTNHAQYRIAYQAKGYSLVPVY